METITALLYAVPVALLTFGVVALLTFTLHSFFGDEEEAEEETAPKPKAKQRRPAAERRSDTELLEAADRRLTGALQRQEEEAEVRKARAEAAQQLEEAARQDRIDRELENAKARVVEWARSIGVLEEFLVNVVAEPHLYSDDHEDVVASWVILEDLDFIIVTDTRRERIMSRTSLEEPVIEVLEAQKAAAESRTAATL